MHQLYLAYLSAGFLVLGLGLYSKPLRKTFLAPPLVALLAGIGLGPAGLRLLRPGEWGDPLLLLEEAAWLTIAIGLMGVALRLPPGYLYKNLKSLILLLGAVMPLMGLTVAGMVYGLMGGSLLACLLAGDTVAPADPVVATSIVTGSAAEENLPSRLRRMLSAESGLIDGLAYPW